jgi:hypothetical protein
LDRYLSQRTPSFPPSHDRESTRDNNSGSFHQQQIFDTNPHLIAQQLDHIDPQQRFLSYPAGSNRLRESSPPPPSIKSDSYVFNVEGLSSPSWNCERLFNLLCLYGNVLRVCSEI